MASSKRREDIGIIAPFENVSERNITLNVLITNDETRNKIPDDSSELSVPHTTSDRQPNTHRKYDSHIQTIRKLKDKGYLNFKCSLFEHSIPAFEFVNCSNYRVKIKESHEKKCLITSADNSFLKKFLFKTIKDWRTKNLNIQEKLIEDRLK